MFHPLENCAENADGQETEYFREKHDSAYQFRALTTLQDNVAVPIDTWRMKEPLATALEKSGNFLSSPCSFLPSIPHFAMSVYFIVLYL